MSATVHQTASEAYVTRKPRCGFPVWLMGDLYIVARTYRNAVDAFLAAKGLTPRPLRDRDLRAAIEAEGGDPDQPLFPPDFAD